jgi:hypothetical protein
MSSRLFKISRRFDTFMSSNGRYYNSCVEVRPDTGAIQDEIELSKERMGVRPRRNYGEESSKKTIGHFVYDFENKTEKFVRYNEGDEKKD